MFEAVVDFASASAVRVDVGAIRRTNLHMHPNAVEVLYVLRGGLHVMVSCETYDLDAGDFAVLNRADPHQLEGGDDNVTAVIHLDPLAFRRVDPHVGQLCFACESWDLARYLRQEALLRGLLLDLVDAVGPNRGRLSTELMRVLCAGYSLESYYHRDARLTPAQHEKFRAIFAAVREHAHRRDVLDAVAAQYHYSKSYVSHVVKDVAAISFSDMLVYLRLANAERLLLTTDATMLDIAAQCGFSDVKYFTRGFVDWFKLTPTEYRTRYRPEVLRDNEISAVSPEVVADLVGGHRRRVASPTEGPRLAITPLLLKNVGSRVDLFDRARARSAPEVVSAAASSGPRHLVPIRVEPTDVESGYLLDALGSFDQINAQSVLVVHFTSKTSTLELVAAVATRLADGGVPMWLVYDGMHDRAAVDQVVAAAVEQGLDAQAVLMA